MCYHESTFGRCTVLIQNQQAYTRELIHIIMSARARAASRPKYTSERERQVSLYLAKLISLGPRRGKKLHAPSSSGRPNFCGPSNGIERERAEFSADFCAPEPTQKVCHPYNYGLVCAAAENPARLPISLNQWTSPSSSFGGRKFLKFSKRRVQQVGIFT